METILCPFCNRENPIEAVNCKYCNHALREDKPLRPLNLRSASAAEASGMLNALPETPGTASSANARASLADEFILKYDQYKTANAAVGAYAEAFIASQNQGKQMILRETAVKRLVSTFVFALAAFITLSLMMLYHRSYFLFFLVFAALGIGYRFLRVDNQALLAKEIASMPQADMENVIMSDIDRMVNKKTVDAIRIGILAVALIAFAALFWSPHMIFERGSDGYSLRYYSASIVPGGNVVIPDTWNGEPVTEIRGNVFEGLGSIESVVLPNQLIRIRAHAFRGCRSLSRVVFPDTIRSIGSSAFRDCPKLKSVTLPEACSVDARSFKNSGTRIERK